MKPAVAITRRAPAACPARAHPEVIDALHELGIDATDHVPQKLNQELIDWADVVVATCDDSCPYVPGKHYVNWQLPDPKNQPIERVRAIRDDIAARVTQLVRDLDAELSGRRDGARRSPPWSAS